MFKLKKCVLPLVLIFWFSGCEKKEDTATKEIEIHNHTEVDVVQTAAGDSSMAVTIDRYYRTVGYFDEKNNLIRIERFLDGELLSATK